MHHLGRARMRDRTLGRGHARVLEGRLQSRSYIKVLDTGAVERTAFEVSVLDICRLSAPDD